MTIVVACAKLEVHLTERMCMEDQVNERFLEDVAEMIDAHPEREAYLEPLMGDLESLYQRYKEFQLQDMKFEMQNDDWSTV